MMQRSKKYKHLYIPFLWHFILFLLTLCVSAAIFQALEKREPGADIIVTLEDLENLEERIKLNFSVENNVPLSAVNAFLADLRKTKEQYAARSISYTEAFWLSMEIFFTVGWGKNVLRTIGGKIFSFVSSIIGIPVTMLMLASTAKLVVCQMLDALRICQLNYYRKHSIDRYADQVILMRSKKLLLPTIFLIIVAYWLLTSLAITSIEKISYLDAVYFSFMALSTIGVGDFVFTKMIDETNVLKAIGFNIFSFLWLFFGIAFIASFILTGLSYTEKPKKLTILNRREKAQKSWQSTHSMRKLRFDNIDSYRSSYRISNAISIAVTPALNDAYNITNTEPIISGDSNKLEEKQLPYDSNVIDTERNQGFEQSIKTKLSDDSNDNVQGGTNNLAYSNQSETKQQVDSTNNYIDTGNQ